MAKASTTSGEADIRQVRGLVKERNELAGALLAVVRAGKQHAGKLSFEVPWDPMEQARVTLWKAGLL